MKTENNKTNEPHKFALSLFQRLNLKISNKDVSLQTLSICYTLKKQQCKNGRLIIITPPWNDGFELPDGSYLMSDI